jgi:hypothetical protein
MYKWLFLFLAACGSTATDPLGEDSQELTDANAPNTPSYDASDLCCFEVSAPQCHPGGWVYLEPPFGVLYNTPPTEGSACRVITDHGCLGVVSACP